MEPALICIHAEAPAQVTADLAVFPGMTTPVLLPLAVLPASVQAQWTLANPAVPPRQRIPIAFAAGLPDAAFAEILRHPEPLLLDARVEAAVLVWAGHEAARLGLGSLRGELCERTADGWVVARDDATQALRDVQSVLPGIGWPRWLGPVLLTTDATLVAPVTRPALPIIALPQPVTGQRASAVIASALALLALDLTAPPPAGWPRWLRLGTAGVVAAVARGEGPSPRAMHERRQRAGAAAITALFTAEQPDPALAEAVCAYLLHTNRRGRFATLLDPLRHGVDSATALGIAYGVTAASLVEQR